MANPSDKAPGASDSGRERADQQSARKPRPDEADIRDLEDPRGDRVKGGVPKQPGMGGPDSIM